MILSFGSKYHDERDFCTPHMFIDLTTWINSFFLCAAAAKPQGKREWIYQDNVTDVPFPQPNYSIPVDVEIPHSLSSRAMMNCLCNQLHSELPPTTGITVTSPLAET